MLSVRCDRLLCMIFAQFSKNIICGNPYQAYLSFPRMRESIIFQLIRTLQTTLINFHSKAFAQLRRFDRLTTDFCLGLILHQQLDFHRRYIHQLLDILTRL